jgi:hypothetical protein
MIKRGPKRTWWSSERFADVFLVEISLEKRSLWNPAPRRSWINSQIFYNFVKISKDRCLRSKFGNGIESVVNHRGWVPKEGPENEDQPLSDSWSQNSDSSWEFFNCWAIDVGSVKRNVMSSPTSALPAARAKSSPRGEDWGEGSQKIQAWKKLVLKRFVWPKLMSYVKPGWILHSSPGIDLWVCMSKGPLPELR